MTLTAVANNTPAQAITDIKKALEFTKSEAPYELASEPVAILDAMPDAVSASVDVVTLNNGNDANRVTVKFKDGRSTVLRVFHKGGKDILFDPKELDIRKLQVATCKSGGKLITAPMVQDGQRYDVARVYAVLD
jgi:hypothetical protein